LIELKCVDLKATAADFNAIVSVKRGELKTSSVPSSLPGGLGYLMKTDRGIKEDIWDKRQVSVMMQCRYIDTSCGRDSSSIFTKNLI
jgi:hypothetical protein